MEMMPENPPCPPVPLHAWGNQKRPPSDEGMGVPNKNLDKQETENRTRFGKATMDGRDVWGVRVNA